MAESEENIYCLDSIQINVEGVLINFKVDAGVVPKIISEKVYLRHFSKMKLFDNDLR